MASSVLSGYQSSIRATSEPHQAIRGHQGSTVIVTINKRKDSMRELAISTVIALLVVMYTALYLALTPILPLW